jgi:predicted Zn-dependent peptidase
MQKYTLPNGLTVIENKKQSDSVTVQITVKVGSNYEKNGIHGISHFIEHMLFEGTKNRKDAKEISNEIESLGGEINAYTNNVRTCFYVKLPKKHFKIALDIVSDIIKNPLFRENDIKKERKVILKEINIFNDESRHYQWILFANSLFIGHPSKYPAYGTRGDVRRITRKDLLDYFNRYYIANNSILSIVGNVKDSRKLISRYFGDFRKGKSIIPKKVMEPAQKKPKIAKIKRKIMNSYMVLGYKTVPRSHPDSYALDIILAILGRGQSGKMFDEIRNKRGLAYEVGIHHEPSTDFGFFAVYLSADKSKIPLIKKIIHQELAKLSKITDKEIKEAKGFVEGKYLLDNEDTRSLADELAFWELIRKAELAKDYPNRVNRVTKKDIARITRKYFTKNYTMAIIEQEIT